MNAPQPASESPEELRELFEAYKARHTRLYTWSAVFWVITLPARLAKKDPFRSLPGVLLTWGGVTLFVLLPLVAAVALTSSWNSPQLPVWIAVTVIYGGLVASLGPLIVSADENLLSLHGSMATSQGLRRLIAWDRRWFSYPVDLSLVILFTAFSLVAFLLIHKATGNFPIPIGVQVIGFFVFMVVGVTASSLLLLVCEIPLLIREKYQVFRYNPAHTQAFQRSLQGYTMLAGLDSLLITVIICLAALLLPLQSGLVLPNTLALLGLGYSSIALVVIAPRLLIGQIVNQAKEQELAILQEQISTFWVRRPQLSADERKELKRLMKIYERLASAPNISSSLGRVTSTLIGALFLPTITTIVTVLVTRLLSK